MAEMPKDLDERTEEFALAVREFVRRLPRTISNIEDVKQLVRASASVAANCIEANEALGPKDRIMRFRISRKEAKESRLFLRLLNVGGSEELEVSRVKLRNEAHELKLILSSIINKLE